MPPRKTPVMEGQLKLSMPTVEPYPGLVHVLTPEYLDLDPAHYDDITPQMIALAGPANLRSSLIDVPAGSNSAVLYRPASNPDRRVYLAVTPDDYTLLDRYPNAMSRQAYNRTLASANRPEEETINEKTAAAHRASAHVHEAYQDRMRTHVAAKIAPRLNLIRRFQKAATHPNLSQIGDRDEMRLRFTELTRDVIGGMLLAVQSQRGWTDENYDLASRSITKAFVFAEQPGIRARNFGSMLHLANEWYGHKNALFLERIHLAGRKAVEAYNEAAKYTA